ncbi:MAG: hypothetical protein H0X59_04545 [Chloroflexi bacterium]|nr:hypothetical protein [Chloroflexota bacterium]
MSERFDEELRDWLTEAGRVDTDRVQRLASAIDGLPARRRPGPSGWLRVSSLVLALGIVSVLVALVAVPYIGRPGTSSSPTPQASTAPVTWLGDPRYERCGGGTGENVLQAFPMAQASDYRRHLPQMGLSPELDVSAPAFVVIFREGHPFPVVGGPPRDGEGESLMSVAPSSGQPRRHDLCVLVGSEPETAELHVYGEVDVSGLTAVLVAAPADFSAVPTLDGSLAPAASASPGSAPTTSPAPEPALLTSVPEVGRPRFATGQVLRRDDGSVAARVSLLAPRAGGRVTIVEAWTFRVSGPVDSEGAYVQFYPRPGSDMILIRVGGLGAFLWTLGAPTAQLEWPDELLHAATLHWSPDGRELAGYAWRRLDTIALWEPVEGAVRRVSAPELRRFGSVIGWTADSTQLIVFAEPIQDGVSSAFEAACRQDPWSGLVDARTGATVPFHRGDDFDARGGLRGFLSPSVASSVGAVLSEERVTVYADCQDLSLGGTQLALPGAAQARDLRWSGDGRTLLAMAADGQRSMLLRYDRPDIEPEPGRVMTHLLPPDALLGDVSAGGRWVLVAGEDPRCLSRELLDTEMGASWTLDLCEETSALVP